MQSAQKPIVVVGSINLDLVARAEHIPNPGETLLGSSFQMHPGGKGANQAVAIARLGYPVQLIGQLGSDLFGKQLREHLLANKVDLSAVGAVDGSSGVAVIAVAERGENSIIVIPGANAFASPAFLDQHIDVIRNAGAVLAQLEIPLVTILRLAEICTEAKIPFILDPAPARDLPDRLLAQVTWFTPNETEAAFYLGDQKHLAPQSDPTGIASALLAKGVSGVILKMGSQGAFLATSAATRQIAPFSVGAIDSTAAGDAFNGAFATALMLGYTPERSAQFASAASAISVTREGAQPSMPSRAEVEQLLQTVASTLHP